MLKHCSDDCWTKDQRVEMFLRGLVAADPDSGAEMDASGGRRRLGRGRRYSCSIPTGETQLGYLNTNNPRPIPVKRRAFSVTAHSETEAVERANKALVRFLSKNPVWSGTEYNWTFQKEARI